MCPIRPIRFIAVLWALFATVYPIAPGYCDEPLPHEYLDKIASMPDFCQGDERFGALPGHGSELCAPAALSNTFFWLNGHGFPKVIGKQTPSQADQANLIRKLCSADFMKTDEKIGTPPKNVIGGMQHYLNNAGYGCHVEQMGWRSSVHRIGKIPDEKWLLKSCMGKSNVLINVGWYKSHEKSYARQDGHWVTLVGFKQEQGRHTLYIHDPGNRSGIDKKTEACPLIPLPKHHLLSLQNNESINADGYFELRGIHLKKGTDLAIIDGAVAFSPVDQ